MGVAEITGFPTHLAKIGLRLNGKAGRTKRSVARAPKFVMDSKGAWNMFIRT
jgi:hypothetical protein